MVRPPDSEPIPKPILGTRIGLGIGYKVWPPRFPLRFCTRKFLVQRIDMHENRVWSRIDTPEATPEPLLRWESDTPILMESCARFLYIRPRIRSQNRDKNRRSDLYYYYCWWAGWRRSWTTLRDSHKYSSWGNHCESGYERKEPALYSQSRLRFGARQRAVVYLERRRRNSATDWWTSMTRLVKSQASAPHAWQWEMDWNWKTLRWNIRVKVAKRTHTLRGAQRFRVDSTAVCLQFASFTDGIACKASQRHSAARYRNMRRWHFFRHVSRSDALLSRRAFVLVSGYVEQVDRNLRQVVQSWCRQPLEGLTELQWSDVELRRSFSQTAIRTSRPKDSRKQTTPAYSSLETLVILNSIAAFDVSCVRPPNTDDVNHRFKSSSTNTSYDRKTRPFGRPQCCILVMVEDSRVRRRGSGTTDAATFVSATSRRWFLLVVWPRSATAQKSLLDHEFTTCVKIDAERCRTARINTLWTSSVTSSWTLALAAIWPLQLEPESSTHFLSYSLPAKVRHCAAQWVLVWEISVPWMLVGLILPITTRDFALAEVCRVRQMPLFFSFAFWQRQFHEAWSRTFPSVRIYPL